MFWCCCSTTVSGTFDVWQYETDGTLVYGKDHHDGASPGTNDTPYQIDVSVLDDGSFVTTGPFDAGTDVSSFNSAGTSQWTADTTDVARKCVAIGASLTLVSTDDNSTYPMSGVTCLDNTGAIEWESGAGGVDAMYEFNGHVVQAGFGMSTVWILSRSGTPTSGTFYFSYNGDDSSTVAYNASAATIAAALLEILPGYTISVTGSWPRFYIHGIPDGVAVTSSVSPGSVLFAERYGNTSCFFANYTSISYRRFTSETMVPFLCSDRTTKDGNLDDGCLRFAHCDAISGAVVLGGMKSGWTLYHEDGQEIVSIEDVTSAAPTTYDSCLSAIILDNGLGTGDIVSAWRNDSPTIALACHDRDGNEIWLIEGYGVDPAGAGGATDLFGTTDFAPQLSVARDGEILCYQEAAANPGWAKIDPTDGSQTVTVSTADVRATPVFATDDWVYTPSREGGGVQDLAGGREAIADGSDDGKAYPACKFIFAADDDSEVFCVFAASNMPFAALASQYLYYGTTPPTSGTWKVSRSGTDYVLNWNSSADDIQTAIYGVGGTQYIYGQFPLIVIKSDGSGAFTFTDIDLDGDMAIRTASGEIMVVTNEDGGVTDWYVDSTISQVTAAHWRANGLLTLGVKTSAGNFTIIELDCTAGVPSTTTTLTTIGHVDSTTLGWSTSTVNGVVNYGGGYPFCVQVDDAGTLHVAHAPQRHGSYIARSGSLKQQDYYTDYDPGFVPRRYMASTGERVFSIDAAPIKYKSGGSWTVSHNVACERWWELVAEHPYNPPFFHESLWGTGPTWNGTSWDTTKGAVVWTPLSGASTTAIPTGTAPDAPQWLTSCVVSSAIHYLWIDDNGKLVRWTDGVEYDTDGGASADYKYHHIACAGGDYVYFVRYRNHSTNAFDAVGRLATSTFVADWSDGPGVGVATGSTGTATCPGYVCLDPDGTHVWFTTLLIST